MPLSALGVANTEQGITMLYHPEEDGMYRPFPSRDESMHLNVVRPKDLPAPKPVIEMEDSSSLRTHDIDKARAEYLTRTLHAAGPPHKDVVPGSFAPSMSRHQDDAGRTRIDRSLLTADIEGAMPKAKGFRTTRNLNPLTPRYNIPACEQKPVTPPSGRMHEGKLRETMEFKAERNLRIYTRDYVRNPMETRDIEYSIANYSNRVPPVALTPRDPMKIIEKSGERILSTKNVTPRHRHPLAPEYDVDMKTTHPYYRSEADPHYAPGKVGLVERSTPRVLHRDNGEPQASLIRSDLPGAVPQRRKGHMPFSIYDPPEVTPSQMEPAWIVRTSKGLRQEQKRLARNELNLLKAAFEESFILGSGKTCCVETRSASVVLAGLQMLPF
eukprot:CAMPEP_0197622344 /NCGR_PEP_ID=MMETSP1338-20131121/2698_1 /TAXON_ID=43686 ORGANISM="Pelagodinium beii, Strain RCC1491" /NCGR_SAMPLE_ID=MMETSP1338 /ASSEMBLY_ACC=CAM_ASM_000754 /LENGTH=383 /DNA_ID=CAMNT_0043192071 /DNA_START=42 /DNA_END=1191 /DNA_ORIENTATION=+